MSTYERARQDARDDLYGGWHWSPTVPERTDLLAEITRLAVPAVPRDAVR